MLSTSSTVAAALASALCLGAASTAMAESARPNGGNVAEADSASAKAPVAVVSARAAVMVRSYTYEPEMTLRRNKGFKSIRHAATGVYCLTPIGGIKAKESIASVSVNWIASYGDSLLATIAAPSSTCTGKEFEVRTFKAAAGADFLPSDDVSFTLVVP